MKDPIFYNEAVSQLLTNYDFLLKILLGAFAAIVGTQWLWNIKSSKDQIKHEVEKQIDDYQTRTTEKLTNTISEEIDKSTKNAIDKLTHLEADLARSYGNYCTDKEFIAVASVWWASALKGYLDTNSQNMVGVSVDNLSLLIKNPKWKDQVENGSLSKDEIDDLVKLSDQIPDYFKNKRIKIMKIIKSAKIKETP